MKRLPRSNISYVFSREMPAAVELEPGDSITAETEDAFTHRFVTEADIALLISPPGPTYSNPVTGPIMVVGAEPGDTLVVHIDDIRCDTQGCTAYRPTRHADLVSEPRLKITPIREGHVVFSDSIRIPVNPMVGTIGTVPPLEALSSVRPGPHGGNMDCVDVGIGSTLYLPVYVGGPFSP